MSYPGRNNFNAWFVNMVSSDERKILIKHLHQLKGYNARQLRTEFPDKGWTTSSINRLFKKFRDTGTVDRRQGSDRPRTARTDENNDQVNDMFLSQQGRPELTAQYVKYHWRQAFLSHLLSTSYERICSWNALRGNVHNSWLRRTALLVSYFWRSFFPVCRGLHLLYRWKDVHCGCSSEIIVKISWFHRIKANKIKKRRF